MLKDNKYLKVTSVLNDADVIEHKTFNTEIIRELSELKIIFADKRSYEIFNSDCNGKLVKGNSWKNTIIKNSPDLFLLSSCAVIENYNNSSWIWECIEFCKLYGVKIVFWDFFDDNLHYVDFADFAKEADCVFAVSLDKVLFYKTEIGLSGVYFLPFCARKNWVNLDCDKIKENELCFLSELNDENTEYFKKVDEVLSTFKNNIKFTAGRQSSFKYRSVFDKSGKYKETDISNLKYGGFYDFYREGLFVPEEVFKIIASGAFAVGNSSRGAERLFGESVLTQKNSDDYDFLGSLSQPDYLLEKKVAVAYRKVLLEHLCRDRLNYIYEKTFGVQIDNSLPSVEVFCFAGSITQAYRVIEMFSKQSVKNKKLTVILQNGADCNIEGVRFLSEEEAAELKLGEVSDAEFFTVFSVYDYYGENYLLDLLLPFRVAKLDVAVKRTYFCSKNDIITEESAYDNKEIFRSVIKADNFTGVIIKKLLNIKIPGVKVTVNKFNYCKNFSGLQCDAVDDTEIICKGKSLNRLCDLSDTINTYNGLFYDIDLSEFYNSVQVENDLVSSSFNNGLLTFNNTLYSKNELICSKRLSIDECSCNGYVRVIVLGKSNKCSVRLSVYDKDNRLTDSKDSSFNTPIIIKIQDDSEYAVVSLIFEDFGSCCIRRIISGDEYGLSASLLKYNELINKADFDNFDNKFKLHIQKPDNVFIKIKKPDKYNIFKRSFDEIHFACIMNSQSYKNNFCNFNSVLLQGEDYNEKLKNADLLLIEYSQDEFESPFETVLDSVEYCSLNGIPVVLICQNISEFSDKFIKLGSMADYIFTVDIDTIPDYKKLFNNNDVYLFAPALSFNMLDLFSDNKNIYRKIRQLSSGKSSFFDVNDLLNIVDGNHTVAYSRALRNYFGDLVFSDGNIVFTKKQRLALVRKISEEFLYENRLLYVFSKVFGKKIEKTVKCAEVFGFADSAEEAENLIVNFERQSYENKHLNIVCSFDYDCDERIRVINSVDAITLNLSEIVDDGYIFVFSHNDYYGENYIKDLAAVLKNTDFNGVGKKQYFSYENYDYTLSDEKSYSLTGNVDLVRAGVKFDIIKNRTVDSLEDLTLYGNYASSDIFNYCRNYTNNECIAVDDDVIEYKGRSCKSIENIAEKLTANEKYVINIFAKDYYDGILNNPNVTISLYKDDRVFIGNTGENSQGQFVHCNKKLMISDCNVKNGKIKFRFNGSTDKLRGYLTFYNKQDEKIGYTGSDFNICCLVDVPKGSYYIKFSVEAERSVYGTFDSVSLRGVDDVDTVFIPKNGTVILTNQYPSESNIYRNMFVHKRMLGYKSEGYNCDLVSVSYNNKENVQRIYETIDVTEGGYQLLETILESNEIKTLCVHFINDNIWQIVKPHIHKLNLIIWCHGYDIYPWWRRAFAYHGKELERQKAASEIRVKMWRDIFKCLKDENIKIVFVSKSLRDDIFEDYNVTVPEDKYTIIHSFIDTETFNYIPKDISQRTKIMSVKSYSTSVYANDITANAILELSKTDIFDKLEFDLYGDGPLFDECNKEIMNFENVHFHREFIEHSEIARLHKEHGIYLGTTRSDTQGVSRDEAMSSGLVPIANAVCAIPEFVDSNCGILVPGEDYKGVARGIIDLYNNPELFLKLSENAAKRVRSQTSKEYTVDKELALMKSVEQKKFEQ